MTKKITLEEKYLLIKNKLGQNTIIYFEDIRQIFPNRKKQSLYWDLSKLVDAGYLIRVRNGVYKLSEDRIQPTILLSTTAKKVMKILDETGFDYYISGIDILSKFLHHIPESYPIMVFAQKEAADEITEVLRDNDYIVVGTAKKLSDFEAINILNNRKIIILNQTESFTFTKNNLATLEKAFLDLFFEITRNQYPLALQELARIYRNAVRNGAIDQKKLVKLSYVRNMQYDMRYVVESKYISDAAFRFVKLLKEENN
ncbi:MAG: hypothetical protein KGZ96_13225 [Clostridia bacterium]|jgi:predicted transcriptional regulator of viral defense system|nr:hypothetical protein [Clostridia bacterium]